MKKDCKKGYSCGASCINNSYSCKSKSATAGSKELFNKYISSAKLKQLVDNNTLLATLYNDNAKQKYKTVAQNHPEFNNIEAMSLASWVGGKYFSINKDLLGIEPTPWAKSAAKGIESALAKLPGVTEATLQNTAEKSNVVDVGKAKSKQYIEAKQNGNKYALTRNIKIGDPESFLESNNLKKGEKYVLDHLFATSFDPELSTFDGNIAYKINSPIDGTSKGKAVDDIKTSRWESELLFPRGTRFTVDEISKSIPSKDEISMPKVKPQKAQQALTDLLASLEGKTEDELLNMPEPDLSNLSKTDAKKLLKTFNAMTNYKYTILLTELIDV